MITIALVFIVVVSVPLGITAQHWLYKGTGEDCNPEWELYQQRFDEYTFVLLGRTERSRG